MSGNQGRQITLLRLLYCFFLFSPTSQWWGVPPRTFFYICIHSLGDLTQIYYFKYKTLLTLNNIGFLAGPLLRGFFSINTVP